VTSLLILTCLVAAAQMKDFEGYKDPALFTRMPHYFLSTPGQCGPEGAGGGHTDNVGSAESNLTLSGARAAAVVKALAQRGIGANRLARGIGGPAVVT
jgi:hypothetical protein